MIKVLVHAKMTDQQLDSLRQVSPDLLVVRETDREKAREQMRDADILCTYRLPGPLAEAESLRWIQLVSAGVEHLYDDRIEEKDVVVTTASGIHGPAITEYVICMMVMLSRRLPQILRESAQRQWRPSRARTYYGDELHGKTLGIVGFGKIGRTVAAAARCLGLRVLALKRSPVDPWGTTGRCRGGFRGPGRADGDAATVRLRAPGRAVDGRDSGNDRGAAAPGHEARSPSDQRGSRAVGGRAVGRAGPA